MMYLNITDCSYMLMKTLIAVMRLCIATKTCCNTEMLQAPDASGSALLAALPCAAFKLELNPCAASIANLHGAGVWLL